MHPDSGTDSSKTARITTINSSIGFDSRRFVLIRNTFPSRPAIEALARKRRCARWRVARVGRLLEVVREPDEFPLAPRSPEKRDTRR